MINSLRIEGFKAFDEASFRMAPLTVLSGINGSGKTSLIHSLLVLSQATERDDGIVSLNGPFHLELGSFGLLQNWNSDHVMLGFELDSEFFSWELKGAEASLFAEATGPNIYPSILARDARGFQYISAERYGPRGILGSSAIHPRDLEVGVKGEYCAHVLYALDSLKVDDSRAPANFTEETRLLKPLTEAWLSRVTRPLQIDTEAHPALTAFSLRFRDPDGEWVGAPNMGFGVTYSLPVILAGLTAANGGILVIENPEAHLHPAGQSQMGVFLATIAASGVQVVVETHSDHVVNGIRRAIGEHKILSSHDAIVHYFPLEGEVEELLFTEVGGVDKWPKGFFDQYQMDISALTKTRRSR